MTFRDLLFTPGLTRLAVVLAGLLVLALVLLLVRCARIAWILMAPRPARPVASSSLLPASVHTRPRCR
jgi:hypothetical protein